MNSVELNKNTSKKMPVVYVPHGGGPLPLLGEPGHKALTAFLKDLPQHLPQPKAILMISAHWENKIAKVSSAQHPQMFYDYGGFPAECYEYQYPAPGEPALASKVANLLTNHGIDCDLDAKRGYDHGTFVPLMLMYPKANIPVVQLSLLNSLNPAKHIALGEAIASLRDEGVLIIGSGLSFHNITPNYESSKVFDDWLTKTVINNNIEETKQNLINWEQAPAARYCHVREEHLLPLHVCFGAALNSVNSVKQNYASLFFGSCISGFIWQ